VLPLDQIIQSGRRLPEVSGSFESNGNSQLRDFSNSPTRSAPDRRSRP